MKFLKSLFAEKPPAPVDAPAPPAVTQPDSGGSDLRETLLRDLLGGAIDKVDASGQPNLSSLAMRLRDLDNLALNVKYFGFDLARRLAAELPPRTGLAYRNVGLSSKPSTQADLESDWSAYWAGELKVPVIFHRKLWEFCYVLQALAEHGRMVSGMRGIGFGCGEEPLASYLASRGVATLVTDLDGDAGSATGWRDTNQHLSSLDLAFKRELVTYETFQSLVQYANVDMNAIPPNLTGFDFCWSICALEHLGSIEKAMAFVENSLETLAPDGVAVHTTEFNFLDNGRTLDNWPTVLPQRAHFEALAHRLTAAGHWIAPLDFNIGQKPLDRFIDVPPYPGDPSRHLEIMGAQGDSNHLKMSVDGFASTCFGLIIRKVST